MCIPDLVSQDNQKRSSIIEAEPGTHTCMYVFVSYHAVGSYRYGMQSSQSACVSPNPSSTTKLSTTGQFSLGAAELPSVSCLLDVSARTIDPPARRSNPGCYLAGICVGISGPAVVARAPVPAAQWRSVEDLVHHQRGRSAPNCRHPTAGGSWAITYCGHYGQGHVCSLCGVSTRCGFPAILSRVAHPLAATAAC